MEDDYRTFSKRDKTQNLLTSSSASEFVTKYSSSANKDDCRLYTNHRHGNRRTYMMLLLVCLVSMTSVAESFSSISNSKNLLTSTSLFVVEADAPSVTRVPPLLHPKKGSDFSVSIMANGDDQIISKGEENDSKEENAASSMEDESVTESTTAESSENYEDEEDKAKRLGKTAQAAALLARRAGGQKRRSVSSKRTSVGARRVGSATQSRIGDGSVTKLTDAIRKAASANSPSKSSPSNPKTSRSNDSHNASSRVSDTMIKSTVEGMLNTPPSLGVMGPPSLSEAREIQSLNPKPGAVLLTPEKKTNVWKPADRITVRVAETADDMDIANLRLSVFSNFSPDMRKAFCSRSCQVLSTRRNRGALCVVATVPRYGSLLNPRTDIILGSAECSFHEFHSTKLGMRRAKNSILYVTEVAVSPTARKKGIGTKIMKSVDKIAAIRDIETVYLHVDVCNYQAIKLYENSGYSILPKSDSTYYEFTKSLNLHDGATKGRNHYLMHKDLKKPTWLPAKAVSIETEKRTLGFEISA